MLKGLQVRTQKVDGKLDCGLHKLLILLRCSTDTQGILLEPLGFEVSQALLQELLFAGYVSSVLVLIDDTLEIVKGFTFKCALQRPWERSLLV